MPVLTCMKWSVKGSALYGLLLMMALPLMPKSAFGQNPTEFQLKAVFIYNLVNFVEWPASAFEKPSDPFVIGVVGQNVFGTSLEEAVAGETYHGRRIEVRYFERADQATGCHIVYVQEDPALAAEMLAAAKGKAILTICDADDFMQAGGMIRFYLDRSQLRMEINQGLVSNHGLVLSSKLLRLVKVYNQ